MKIFSQKSIILSTFLLSILRFFTIPIDDYPDIADIYKNKVLRIIPDLESFLNLIEVFRKSDCKMFFTSNIFSKYLFGGAYDCDYFSISFSYFYFTIFLSILLIILLIYHLKKLDNLFIVHKVIFTRTIFFLISIPSTLFFLLSIHIDVPYYFLSISFILSFFYYSIRKKLGFLYLYYIIPFIVLYLLNPDNQAYIFIGLIFVSICSAYLSKIYFVQRILQRISKQSINILNYRLFFSKSIFIYLLGIIFLLGFLFYYKYEILIYLAKLNIFSLSKIFSIYSDSIVLDKYPYLIRIYGSLLGFILSTPFGFGFSFISTSLLFFCLIIGFLKFFSSSSSLFPDSLKTFILLSFLYYMISISILPPFAYYKYWLFLSPIFCLFLAFNPRSSLICLSLLYFEYILRSPLITLS